MKVKIKSNPGSNDFPELKPLPTIGEVCECSEATGTRLVKRGLAEAIQAEVKPEVKTAPGPAKAPPKTER